jgi:hypothetical protein
VIELIASMFLADARKKARRKEPLISQPMTRYYEATRPEAIAGNAKTILG